MHCLSLAGIPQNHKLPLLPEAGAHPERRSSVSDSLVSCVSPFPPVAVPPPLTPSNGVLLGLVQWLALSEFSCCCSLVHVWRARYLFWQAARCKSAAFTHGPRMRWGPFPAAPPRVPGSAPHHWSHAGGSPCPVPSDDTACTIFPNSRPTLTPNVYSWSKPSVSLGSLP